jgi:maltose O-acetyltransferase
MNYLSFKRDRLRLKGLMKRGLKVGRNVYIFEGVEFDPGYPYLIEIGDNCRIAKHVTILAHDATTFRELGITRIAPVKILDGSFIGQSAIILPGVTIGPRALVAAGSVVNRDIPEGKAAAGNPARPYGDYKHILDQYVQTATSEKVFNIEDIESGRVTPQKIKEAVGKFSVSFVRSVPKRDPFYVNTNMDQIRKDAVEAFKKHCETSLPAGSSGLPGKNDL